ncbi:MAG: CBS domain-containing protein [bacterium]|nr:CBS domain-containing protein [bacterium]
MALEKVKDIMTPLDDYAVVLEDATMLDALRALEEAQKKLPPGRQPHRAVLVVNKENKIVGKLGHLAFLKGLEPRYSKMGDLGVLSRVGLSSDFISSMMDNMNLWKESFTDYVNRAKTTRVKDVMHSATESIDEEAPLGEAIHRIVMYQSLSILVTRADKVVGILRISDLFSVISKLIIKKANL